MTEEEDEILAMVRVNKLWPRTEIRKEWRVGKKKVVFHWRSKKNLWGRFGGGWNWKLGINVGGSIVILDLLIFSLEFRKV